MLMRGTRTWIPSVDYSPYAREYVRAIDAICDPTIGPLIDIVWLHLIHLDIAPTLPLESNDHEWK